MPFRGKTDGLVSGSRRQPHGCRALKRRRVSVACVSNGNTAQLSGEQSGYYSPEKLPLCLSSFTLLVRWLHLLTPDTYRSKLLGVPRLAAFLQREIHRALTGKDCNPQPANCLKDQYVLRHCCVDDRSGKIGSFRKSSCFNKIQHGNKLIIPLLTLL